jgi:hypothetical protein
VRTTGDAPEDELRRLIRDCERDASIGNTLQRSTPVRAAAIYVICAPHRMTKLAASDCVEPGYLPVVVVTIRSANAPSQRGFITEETSAKPWSMQMQSLPCPRGRSPWAVRSCCSVDTHAYPTSSSFIYLHSRSWLAIKNAGVTVGGSAYGRQRPVGPSC